MFDADEWREALAGAQLRMGETVQRLPLWDICGAAQKHPET